MNEPLFSLIILCYRKFEHLYTAIDSALLQNYPNIELIISDDGSAEFPRSDIETYISKQKSENITNVLVRQEEVNCGTVRHLNHAIAAAHGDYIVALAGDDAFYNENVLSAYVEGFSRAPENCYIEMAHTAMYDSALTKLESYYLKPIVQKAIEKTETDSSDLLEALIKYGACMPSTSTCFKRTFFEKFGKFDEKYTLIEDYPMHIRLAEEGWIIHFENFVAIKHRNGGISHGRENTKRKSVVLYFTDFQQMIQDCTLPRMSVLNPKDRDRIRYRTKQDLLWIRLMLARTHGLIGTICALGLQHPLISFSFIVSNIGPRADIWHKRLFLPMLALLAFFPYIVQMAETALPCAADLTVGILAGLRVAVCVLWCLCRIFAWMDAVRAWMNHYSGYWLSIN